MRINKLLFGLVSSLLLGLSVCSCKTNEDNKETTSEYIDYTTNTKLDMNSKYAKYELDFKLHIDGDTTHFYCDASINADEVFKVRYLGVDTPESTGKIEPWGKAASNFTKSKLKEAHSIIVESDSETFELDSTGGRYLAFVWYQTNEGDDYRCLNIELMQYGYSKAYSGGKTHYAEQFAGAWAQAQAQKLRVYSDDVDPDYDYGENRPNITIKELRTNIDSYVDKAVRFEGTVTYVYDNDYMLESVDAEDGLTYGIKCYGGYNLSGLAKAVLSVGNVVSVAGTVTYSDGFGYTVNDLTYMPTRPTYDKNIRLIEEGDASSVVPSLISASEVTSKGAQLQNCLVKLTNLYVSKIYTTAKGNSEGAMTITCKQGSQTCDVRTSVLYEEDNVTKITASAYEGKTIDVIGVLEEYEGSYQVHVYIASEIIVH